jgi:hypothetical protein
MRPYCHEYVYKACTVSPRSSSCPAIGAAAAVATTKFPSQLSTHLTRLVIHLHPVPANPRTTHSPWTLNTSLPLSQTSPRSGAVSESPPVVRRMPLTLRRPNDPLLRH